MEPRGKDKFIEERSAAETPEDVAVLYSWANLHGAKYRDFSASRREYRAQLRHRAAEQEREQALHAQAEAEAAAIAADDAARKAAEAARAKQGIVTDSGARRALREAEEAAKMAAAERVEAARRAEAAAMAEAAARREEREIAEAHASAQRQAARYAESEIRRRELGKQTQQQVPGQIADPYTSHPQPQPPVSSSTQSAVPTAQSAPKAAQEPPASLFAAHQAPPVPPPPPPQPPQPLIQRTEPGSTSGRHTQTLAEVVSKPISSDSGSQWSQRRPQGYHPDEASGVRQIYRRPEYDAPRAEYAPPSSPVRQVIPSLQSAESRPSGELPMYAGKRLTDPQPSPGLQQGKIRQVPTDPAATAPPRTEGWQTASGGRSVPDPEFEQDYFAGREQVSPAAPGFPGQRPVVGYVTSPVVPAKPAPQDSMRGRRAQDNFSYQSAAGYSDPPRRVTPEGAPESASSSGARAPYVADPAGPAWLYAPPPAPELPQRSFVPPPPTQSSVAETLQHSRERVAARWYALKGVFEQPGQEPVEAAPVRQKEIRTPVLAVFSLAGGVGKTSLVATVGRSLSSLGEKVLLADTTSHGLLPFYFGASELRHGTVRTFSPPSGSTDAPIYLVSYDVEEKAHDDEGRQQLTDEILNSSRGTHRILLDLTGSSGWIVRQLARMTPTVLVPLAPDMNSVISLQAIEKFFHGMTDGDGRPLEPYYVLNQFDASLPLHLDVREVLRRQLGDRLLPFVIHRAPVVSEALAEGMTVVDYSPDSAVSEDYMNVATWLRTIAAPAAAGFRNVRWSER